MPSRRHSADLRGRRQDLGIGVRDMAAGLGVGMGRLLSMEDGTATEEVKTVYRAWLSRSERGPPARAFPVKGLRRRPPVRMPDRSMLCWDSHRRAGKNLGWLGSARRDALCDERRRLNLGSRLGAQIFVGGGEKACRSNHAAKGRSRACIEGKKLIRNCCRRALASLHGWTLAASCLHLSRALQNLRTDVAPLRCLQTLGPTEARKTS